MANTNNDRSWNENFRKYVESIVSDPAYEGLYYERKADGTVKWVVTKKSAQGRARTEWWNNKCRSLNIPIQPGCYAIVSRMIHPTKIHVCQCCGRPLSIYQIYPAKPLLKKINEYFGTSISQVDHDIYEIIDMLCSDQADIDFIAGCFGQTAGLSKDELKDIISKNFVGTSRAKQLLSPGVMSNNPDRFDGFHSDGLCCREVTDKGRHTDNMKTYIQDRRAYEDWSDGDYNLANRLMGEFQKDSTLYECPGCHESKKMSPDHIGPISLGFRHHTYFKPLCTSCNSSKNNRFTYEDVKELLEIEQNEEVISWHSKHIWNKVKHLVVDDDTAKTASNIMASAHQNVLYLLYIIYRHTGKEFLSRYLHPEYSLTDYRFENFDPFNLKNLIIKKKPLTSANKLKNQERAARIPFESLEEFAAKENRRHKFYHDSIAYDIDNIISAINAKEFDMADALLKAAIARLADIIFDSEWPAA